MRSLCLVLWGMLCVGAPLSAEKQRLNDTATPSAKPPTKQVRRIDGGATVEITYPGGKKVRYAYKPPRKRLRHAHPIAARVRA